MAPSISAVNEGERAEEMGVKVAPRVIEVGLLLRSESAEALVDLARSRRQSVAQVIRGMIERELANA